MKKRIFSLILLIISVFAVLTLSACNGRDSSQEQKAPSLPEQESECEHRWEMKSQTLPTCISEGKVSMECTFCDKTRTVDTIGECDYDICWEWNEDHSIASLALKCPLEESHSKTVKADIKTLTVSKTCTERGSTTKIASATYEGVTYTDKYVIDYGLGGHDYLYSYELVGESCEDGIIRTLTCKNCDKVQKDVVSTVHYYRYERIKLYSFEELGLCSGSYVTCDSCLCGERKRNYTVSFGGCLITERHTYDSDGNITYQKHELNCARCGVSAITERGIIYHTPTERNYEAYNITRYRLNEEITLINAEIDAGVHGKFNHELEYTYTPPTKESDPYTKTARCTSCPFFFEAYHYHMGETYYELLGDKCTDGVKRTINCTECKNVIEYIYYDHQTKSDLEVYRLEDYFENCDGYATVSECYCGEKLLSVGVNELIDISIEESTEKTDTSIVHTMIKKYSHIDLTVTTATTISLIDGEWVKTSVTKSVRLGEQTTLSTTVDYFVILSEDELAEFNK